MTKQEKIIEAYGDSWNSVKEFVDENGWNQKRDFDWKNLNHVLFDYHAVGHGVNIARPVALKGIENNNGWNLISDTEFEDNEYLLFLRYYEGEGEPPIFTSVLSSDFEIGYFTHWKRIDISKSPLFNSIEANI